MNESSFWSRRLRPNLSPYGFFQRVENGLNAGTPDVAYRIGAYEGWIELKYRERAPVREGTPVFVDRWGLRNEQIAWWYQYLAAGDELTHGGFIIAGCGEQIYVMQVTRWILNHLKHLTMSQLAEHARYASDIYYALKR